jgi:hypothetical protein
MSVQLQQQSLEILHLLFKHYKLSVYSNYQTDRRTARDVPMHDAALPRGPQSKPRAHAAESTSRRDPAVDLLQIQQRILSGSIYNCSSRRQVLRP